MGSICNSLLFLSSRTPGLEPELSASETDVLPLTLRPYRTKGGFSVRILTTKTNSFYILFLLINIYRKKKRHKKKKKKNNLYIDSHASQTCILWSTENSAII